MDSSHYFPHLKEGISLILSQWQALQTAINNGWGGEESRFKYEKLANNLLSYFSQSRALLQVEDVEHILDENMVLLFSAEIEDGSIEQVAEQLMVMYEECLNRNYEPIDKLRKANPGRNVASRSKCLI